MDKLVKEHLARITDDAVIRYKKIQPWYRRFNEDALRAEVAETVEKQYYHSVYVRPLHEALKRLLGLPERDSSRRITLVPDWEHTTNGQVVAKVVLPPTFLGKSDLRSDLEFLFSTRLGIQVRGRYQERGHPIYVEFLRHIPGVLPNRVVLPPDIPGPVHQIPIAQDANQDWVYINLKDETPHVVVSATSNWGKTTTLKVIASYGRAKGARVIVNDPKRIEYLALRDIPGIEVYTSPQDMMGAVASVYNDMMDVYTRIENGEVFTPEPVFLIIDEMATFYDQVTETWKGKETPITFVQLRNILRLGRSADVHLFVGCHQANAKTLLSSEGRDLYGYRIAAGPQSEESWKMLFKPETIKPVSLHPGRGYAGVGRDLIEVQRSYLSDEAARALASQGRPVASPSTTAVPINGSKVVPEISAKPDILIGRAAAASYLGISLAAFDKRRKTPGRDIPGETINGQKCWKAVDLDAWNATWRR